MKHPIALITAAALLACGTTGPAASTENDALAAASAKVSLSQAIGVAEQRAAGKATKAEFERGKQGPVYEVEVVSGSKVFDVKVDFEQGTVLASREDKVD